MNKIYLLITLLVFAASAIAQDAAAYQRRAIAKYPDLGKAHSPFHAKFLSIVSELKEKEPAFVNTSSWPLLVADRTAAALEAESAAKRAPLKAAADELGLVVWSFQDVIYRTNHAREKAAMEALEPRTIATLERLIECRALLKPVIALGPMRISGVVLQKTADGLLITPKKYEDVIVDRFLGLQQYDKLALIRAHPDTSALVDNDTFNCVAVPDGIYSYTSVAGATSTVRAFKWIPIPLKAEKKP